MAKRIYDLIDGLKIGKDWKTTFKKIHITYHKSYATNLKLHPLFWNKTSEVLDLPFLNSLKMNVWFNPLGLIFGPFYYIYNGLYKKGSILLLIFLLLMYGNSATRVMSIFVLIYCAIFINVDCFIKKVLNHPDVLSNPLFIGNDFDQMLFANLLTKKTSPFPYILLVLIMLYPFALEITSIKHNYDVLDSLAVEPKKICDNKQECATKIKDYLKEINSTKNTVEISEKYYNIALAYYSLNDFINTVTTLDTAIEFNNANINAYLLRAKVYSKINNHVQALLDYKEALKINPQAKFLNYNIGFNYYSLGKYERALEYLEKATKIYENPKYFEAQGYTRQMLKDTKGAVKDIKKAISLYKKEGNQKKVKKLKEYIKTIEKPKAS